MDSISDHLYLLVHHPCDPRTTFHNEWTENHEQLRLITTTKHVASLCEAASGREDWVYIHRCGVWKNCRKIHSPTVFSKTKVIKVKWSDRPVVEFGEFVRVNANTPRRGRPGMNFYYEKPV